MMGVEGGGTLLTNTDGQFSAVGDGDAASRSREPLVGVYRAI
jgi:hypothetical protein